MRSAATWVRGRWPSKPLPSTLAASGGAAGREAPGPRPEYALDRPFCLNILHILRLEAVIPDLASATLSLRAP